MRTLVPSLILLLIMACPAAAEVIDVQIKGVDDGVKSNRGRDYKEALLFAKRQALEKAGVELASTSTVRNNVLDEDLIESRSEGVLLPGYQVIDVGYDESGNYVVVLVGRLKVRDRAKTAKGDAWVEVSEPEEVFDKGYFQVVGTSAPGQEETAAKTAARMMAQARLLEIVNGLTLSRDISMSKGNVDKDEIQARVDGYVRQSSVCGEEYDEQEKLARVCLRLRLRRGGLGDTVYDLVSDKVRK